MAPASKRRAIEAASRRPSVSATLPAAATFPSAMTTTVIGQARHLFDRVAHVDDGKADLVAQQLDVGEDLGFPRGVEGSERLVHQQDARAREERAADRDALPFSSREVRGAAVEELREVEELDHAAPVDVALARGGESLAVGKVSAYREMREEERVLEDESDAAFLGRHVDARAESKSVLPSTVIRPRVGRRIPAIACTMEVFPVPERPKSATIGASAVNAPSNSKAPRRRPRSASTTRDSPAHQPFGRGERASERTTASTQRRTTWASCPGTCVNE
jgi:hypothetical protein